MFYYLISILSAVDENASTEEKLKQIEEMAIPEKRKEIAEKIYDKTDRLNEQGA